MKIVILDGCHASQDDLTFDILNEFGEVEVYYDSLNSQEVLERIENADIIVENRIYIGKKEMDFAKNLKFISTISTGYNLVDVAYAREKGIVVSNVPAYSAYAVAQSTVALLLEITSKISPFDKFVKDGKWDRFDNPDMWAIKNIELLDKTIGIIGMGDIGYKVAKICESMGMKVLGYRRTPDLSMENENIKFASLEQIYEKCDVISLHCPLTDETTGLINEKTISKMKDGVIILNTSRGNVIVENDMIKALDNGKVYMLGADVVKNEPPLATDKLHLHEKTIITPHVAWGAIETRHRAILQVRNNIKAYLEGKPINVVS